MAIVVTHEAAQASQAAPSARAQAPPPQAEAQAQAQAQAPVKMPATLCRDACRPPASYRKPDHAVTIDARLPRCRWPPSRERLFLNRFGTGFTQTALAGLRAIGSPSSGSRPSSPRGPGRSHPRSPPSTAGSRPGREPAEKYATAGPRPRALGLRPRPGNWSILRRIYSDAPSGDHDRLLVDQPPLPVGHDKAWVYRFDYDATIRDHALGTFEDLLRACSLHPAMRTYLDPWKSVRGKPNENQGRELLELHTVGRAAGYTEAMVKSSAVLLSGYTVDWGKTFDASTTLRAHHRPGSGAGLQPRQRLRRRSGRDGGLPEVSRPPPRHRSQPCHQARDVLPVRRSVRRPGQLLRRGVPRRRTDITAVLRTLSTHPEFLTSEGQKVRTPFADLVATARVLDVDVPAPSGELVGRRPQLDVTAPTAVLVAAPRRPADRPAPPGPRPPALRRFRDALNQAGGWWPEGATYRTPASWLPVAERCASTRYVDHLCRTLARTGRRRTAAHGAPARPDRLQRRDARSRSPASTRGGWLFPRLAIALLDTPDHMTT